MGALTLGAFGRPEQQVLVQRSAHGISPAELERTLAETDNPKGVYIVTPSYFGAVANVAALTDIAHAAGVPLIVDEAWGAHFGFHPELPQSSLSLGADLVVSSTHKLGGSLTQSAMMHLGDGPFAGVLAPLVQRAYMITMSTSQSALLLASLDIARHSLQMGQAQMGQAIAAVESMRAEIRRRGRFTIVSDSWDFDAVVDSDPLRISVDVRTAGLNGNAVRDELIRSYGIYTEISTDSCIVAFLGPGFAPGTDRFVEALHRLEPIGELAYAETHTLSLPHFGELSVRPRDAWFASAVKVPAYEAPPTLPLTTFAWSLTEPALLGSR